MLKQKNKKLRVAAVGDLHMRSGAEGMHRELFTAVSEAADVLLLCGDLTDQGLPEEAVSLASDLAACKIPVLGVLGNHDVEHGKEMEIKTILSKTGMVFIDDHPFELGGVGFAGVKGFGGGFEKHMLASFGEPVIKSFVAETISESLRLEKLLQELDSKQCVAVLHYSPILATVTGEPPEIFPFLGSSRLAETIDRYPVSAVFHGHAHHGSVFGKTPKGISVYNCAVAVLKNQNPPQQFSLITL
jgi:Icc-related predicted phosphoesterase